MAIEILPYRLCPPERLRVLEEKMIAFYSSPQAGYYQQADSNSAHYAPEERPFHWDLLQRLQPGQLVGEIGCGTGHFGVPAMARGAVYRGWDWGEDLLRENRTRHPAATFLNLAEIDRQPEATSSQDVTVSLYTLEHVVHPPKYLDLLWRLTKPGGLIGIICPEFVMIEGLAPSIFHGAHPARMREKMRGGRVLDLARHAVDLALTGPAARRRLQAEQERPAFWINLRPRILEDADYSIDTDAVHLTTLADLRAWMQGKGAEVITTSADPQFSALPAAKHSLYLLARKPV